MENHLIIITAPLMVQDMPTFFLKVQVHSHQHPFLHRSILLIFYLLMRMFRCKCSAAKMNVDNLDDDDFSTGYVH